MSLYIKKFRLHTQYEHYITGNTTVLPNVSYCEDVKDVHINPIHDYSKDYFTTVALENGTITFTPTNSNVINYSIDNGNTWIEGSSVNVENGVKVMWKGTMRPIEIEYNGIGKFSSTCNFNVEGNVMSLLYNDEFEDKLEIEWTYCFFNLFYGAEKLTNAENLILPATTLKINCYQQMFDGCTSLTSAPKILPAKTSAVECYTYMFHNCTSLVSAPELLATTLANFCYNCMFSGCTSLTTAPELPATTLAMGCYEDMFNGCTNLNYIKAMFTTTPSDIYAYNWVDGVAVSGTFVKNSAATWNPEEVRGVNGVPTGWTIQTA